MTETSTIEANGVTFSYTEEGEGPLVLLAHGFPDTWHTWDAVRPALAAAGYRALSPNMRGYWPTRIPADGAYDSDTLGADLLALIEALGGSQAILVGHDWGASAAYSAASLDPQRVRFLVTLGIPHPASLRPTPKLVWAARHFLAFRLSNAAAKVRANNFAYVDTLVQRWSPAWRVPPGETAPVKAAFRQPGCLEAALGYYRAVGLRPPSSLRNPIRVPSIVFACMDDDVFTNQHYVRASRWYADHHEIVAMPGGHFMHREHPEHFIKELLRVLPSPDEE